MKIFVSKEKYMRISYGRVRGSGYNDRTGTNVHTYMPRRQKKKKYVPCVCIVQ